MLVFEVISLPALPGGYCGAQQRFFKPEPAETAKNTRTA